MSLVSRMFFLISLFLFPCFVYAETKLKAEQILAATDRVRLPTEGGMKWRIKLSNFNDGDESSILYQIRTRGNDSYVEVLEPARKRGEITLFNDRTIWFYKEGQKKPVSLSARQKLSGQAAIGDIVSTNYKRDYQGPLIGEETVGKEPCYVLDLKAKNDKTTYDRVKYYVSKKQKLLVKAIFETSDGEALKTATYEYGNSVVFKKKKVPFTSKITIKNASMESQYSTMEWLGPKLVKVPETLFNVNNLQR